MEIDAFIGQVEIDCQKLELARKPAYPRNQGLMRQRLDV